MVTVKASGALRSALDNVESVEVVAETIKELLERLTDRYPRLAQELENSMVAVAINGDIYRDDWRVPIPEGSEVFLIPRIQGG